MTLKSVIFDFDGTIGDTLPLCLEALRAAIEPLAGRPYSDKEIFACFGPSDEGAVKRLLPERWEEALSSYLRCYEKLHDRYPAPFPGMRDLLLHLKERGLLLTIVTGKGPVSCDISLRRYGISELFDAIETGSPLGPNKPEGIRALLTRFHLTPPEVIYVGDATSDVTAAHETGIRIAAAAWASTADRKKLEAAGPDFLCPSVTNLAKLLETL